MTPNDLLPPLLGGALIGASASLLLVANGRIAGISGIVGELVAHADRDHAWRWAFLGGMLAATAVVAWLAPASLAAHHDRSVAVVVAAGLLVGAGTRLGNGCTSGHGVCGIPRGSTRSLVATAVFIGRRWSRSRWCGR